MNLIKYLKTVPLIIIFIKEEKARHCLATGETVPSAELNFLLMETFKRRINIKVQIPHNKRNIV